MPTTTIDALELGDPDRFRAVCAGFAGANTLPDVLAWRRGEPAPSGAEDPRVARRRASESLYRRDEIVGSSSVWADARVEVERLDEVIARDDAALRALEATLAREVVAGAAGGAGAAGAGGAAGAREDGHPHVVTPGRPRARWTPAVVACAAALAVGVAVGASLYGPSADRAPSPTSSAAAATPAADAVFAAAFSGWTASDFTTDLLAYELGATEFSEKRSTHGDSGVPLQPGSWRAFAALSSTDEVCVVLETDGGGAGANCVDYPRFASDGIVVNASEADVRSDGSPSVTQIEVDPSGAVRVTLS